MSHLKLSATAPAYEISRLPEQEMICNASKKNIEKLTLVRSQRP